MACLVAIATLLRDFRAYGCILAGYTVALISIADVDAPTAAFTSMLDRVAVILLAVLVLAFVSAIFATAESVRSLQSKLRLATKDIVAMALATLDRRAPTDTSQCVAMSARLMPLRSEIGFATPELLDGWARAKGARSALLGLFEAISAIQAVGLGLPSTGLSKKACVPSGKFESFAQTGVSAGQRHVSNCFWSLMAIQFDR
jgi:hypothetical protein